MPLKTVIKEQNKNIYLVMPEGSLDTTTYLSFEEDVTPLLDLDAPVKVMILNMSKLDHISSMGLSAVFKTKKAVEAKGGIVILTELQPQIKKVFDIAKALPDDSIFKNMEEVDKYLNLMQRKEIEKKKDFS